MTRIVSTQSRRGINNDEIAVQLGELVSQISRRLRKSSTKRLAPFGLSDGQARVLRIIGRSPSPLRMSDIAARIEIVPRSATTVIEGLEAKGLVVREIDLEDRRSILVRLTKAGSRLLTELGEARDEAAAALFGHLGHAERAELLRLLNALDAVPASAAVPAPRSDVAAPAGDDDKVPQRP